MILCITISQIIIYDNDKYYGRLASQVYALNLKHDYKSCILFIAMVTFNPYNFK